MDNNAYMQTQPGGVYDQIPEGGRNGFEALDYTLKRAGGEEGLYVVVALTNNWDAFGGMRQYVQWSDTANEHDDFYTDVKVKEMYKAYVSYLLERENSLTGTLYKNDPSVFAWELANEPRCESDKSGDTLVNWVTEMSVYIKGIDANHMVTVGDEGFFNHASAPDEEWAYNGYSGVDWDRLIAIDSIDYGTFHLYPEHWGGEVFSDDPVKSGIRWIEAHVEASKVANKPAVLEEYGITKTGIHNRDYIYESWLNSAQDQGLAGTMFWILSGIDTGDSKDDDGLYKDYDGFRIVNDDSTTTSLLKDHAKVMAGNQVEVKPKVHIVSPYPGQKISEVFASRQKPLIMAKR